MKLVRAPELHLSDRSRTQVFLAGSIEQGKAEPWQKRVIADLEGYDDIIICDPRREQWDSTWVHDPTPGTDFHQQVTWELDAIDNSDLVLFYFDPKTQSPVTMLELGLCIGQQKPMIIYCPDEFFRSGNVEMTVSFHRAAPRVHKTYGSFINDVKTLLSPARHWQ